MCRVLNRRTHLLPTPEEEQHLREDVRLTKARYDSGHHCGREQHRLGARMTWASRLSSTYAKAGPRWNGRQRRWLNDAPAVVSLRIFRPAAGGVDDRRDNVVLCLRRYGNMAAQWVENGYKGCWSMSASARDG